MIYVWLAVIVIAVIIEVVIPGLISIWFVPAALVSILLEFCGVPIPVQILSFLILSVLCIFLTRKFSRHGKNQKTNIDAVIGEKCVVTEKIDNIHNLGKVQFHGMDWTARSINENENYDTGDIVVVRAVEGVKLIVEKQQ